MSDFPIGTKVRAKDPDSFMTDTAKKVRGRVGIVVRHQDFSQRPVVLFEPKGRNREYRWVARDQWLESVADSAEECKAACEVDAR